MVINTCAFKLFCCGLVGLSGIGVLQKVTKSSIVVQDSLDIAHNSRDTHLETTSKTFQLTQLEAGKKSLIVAKLARQSAKSRNATALTRSRQSIPVGDSQIRVKIASHANELSVAASTSAIVMTAERKAVARLEPNTAYQAVKQRLGVQLGNVQAPRAIWIDPGQDGFVFINGSWYRGRVLIANAGRSLVAVNWVDLEHYLYSVVGAEMPTRWNLEALKAQAIAARSYALTHIQRPASSWFDLGNDERWQAYKGVNSEATNTYAAVAATRGQILVKNGRILEALYASTQAITNQAHAGIGMSQYGAQALAMKGQTYLQILARYYPKSIVAQLQYRRTQ